MKHFDLTLLHEIDEENPKIHKISFEQFRQAYVDFPNSLAQRLVETGFARWAPCDIKAIIITPQSLLHPMQFFLINLPTGNVKAIHVNAIVPENGPVPHDTVKYAENLLRDMRFSHTANDVYDADAYDASLEDYEAEVYDEEKQEAINADNVKALEETLAENEKLKADNTEIAELLKIEKENLKRAEDADMRNLEEHQQLGKKYAEAIEVVEKLKVELMKRGKPQPKPAPDGDGKQKASEAKK